MMGDLCPHCGHYCTNKTVFCTPPIVDTGGRMTSFIKYTPIHAGECIPDEKGGKYYLASSVDAEISRLTKERDALLTLLEQRSQQYADKCIRADALLVMINKERRERPTWAEGFAKGRESVLRRNPSGCCCLFNEDEEIVSVCMAHKEREERLMVDYRCLKEELYECKHQRDALATKLSLYDKALARS